MFDMLPTAATDDLSLPTKSDGSLLLGTTLSTRLDGPNAHLYRVYNGLADRAGERFEFNAEIEAAWWLQSGEVELIVGSQTYTGTAGQWILIGPGPRQQFFSRQARVISINYRWGDDTGRPAYPLSRPVIVHQQTVPELNACANNLMDFVKENVGNSMSLPLRNPMSRTRAATLTGLFHLWLSEIGQLIESTGLSETYGKDHDQRIVKAKAILDAAALGANIDYDEVAAAVGLSRSHLERLFRVEYRCTPHRYLERRRADYARAQLVGGSHSIKSIARTLGFRHLSRFSAWFRGHEKCSPREFRKYDSRLVEDTSDDQLQV